MKTLRISTKKKIIKKTKEKELDKQLQKFAEYQGYGSWHAPTEIPLNYLSLQFRGMITGCGLGQMHGVAILNAGDNRNYTEQSFKALLRGYVHSGCGTILCTLGKTYYFHEARLLQLGFKLLYEYPNKQHGTGYTQKLYQITL